MQHRFFGKVGPLCENRYAFQTIYITNAAKGRDLYRALWRRICLVYYG